MMNITREQMIAAGKFQATFIKKTTGQERTGVFTVDANDQAFAAGNIVTVRDEDLGGQYRSIDVTTVTDFKQLPA